MILSAAEQKAPKNMINHLNWHDKYRVTAQMFTKRYIYSAGFETKLSTLAKFDRIVKHFDPIQLLAYGNTLYV